MRIFRSQILIVLTLITLSTIALQSCKSKKIATQQLDETPVKPIVEEKVVEKPIPKDTDQDGIPDSEDNCPEVKGSASNGGCPEEKPKPFNFQNIQFEFNSSVLKTESYDFLEKVSQFMKKNEAVNYELRGNSSAEGSEKRNMMLSVDRANAVKAYLVNNGVSGKRLKTVGLGEANPIADNSTEAGRVKNRRVEIKPVN